MRGTIQEAGTRRRAPSKGSSESATVEMKVGGGLGLHGLAMSRPDLQT